jgi:hypothetical protein
LTVQMVVTDSKALGFATVSVPARDVVSLLFFAKSPEISCSQSRRFCENGGVGIVRGGYGVFNKNDSPKIGNDAPR